MSSILTNNSAMVALQTLQGINKDLAKTQNSISTGLKVGSAADNSAVWAISKTMGSDVATFKAVSEGLSLGDATVAVARQAAETVTDLLTEIKGKVSSANPDTASSADRQKLADDVSELTSQIESVVNAAQFNGVNLLNGDLSQFEVLSSLDRGSDGTVSRASIDVDLAASDLSDTSGDGVSAAVDSAYAGDSANPVAMGSGGTASTTITAADFIFNDGSTSPATTAGTQNEVALPSEDIQSESTSALQVGDTVELEIDGISASYTIRTGDTGESVLGELRDDLLSSGLDEDIELNIDGDGNLVVNTDAAEEAFTVSLTATRGAGGLSGLDQIATSMVSTDQATRDQALNDIEDMISYAIDAAASFGSAQGRIQTQTEFVSTLSDALKTGIGSLVDTNMEEASARLQALQVQQQLGVQSLSIANQAPQTILALFR